MAINHEYNEFLDEAIQDSAHTILRSHEWAKQEGGECITQDIQVAIPYARFDMTEREDDGDEFAALIERAVYEINHANEHNGYDYEVTFQEVVEDDEDEDDSDDEEGYDGWVTYSYAVTRTKCDNDETLMTEYHDTMLEQIKEVTNMAVTESEWENNECQSSITLSVPHKFKALTLDNDEMAEHAKDWFDSWLEVESESVNIKTCLGVAKPYSIYTRYKYTLALDAIVDEDDLTSMGDDDHYLQFEFTITRKLLGLVRLSGKAINPVKMNEVVNKLNAL